MTTPWGTSQSKTVFERGLFIVTTMSHGGLMVSKTKATKLFSTSALVHAISYGNYYCFEEDCAISVAIEDSEVVLGYIAHRLGRTKEDLLALAVRSNRVFYPLYRQSALIRYDKNGLPKNVNCI